MRPLALLHDHTMSLKDWITRHLGGSLDATGRDDGGGVDLAVAALLVEVLRADYDVAPQERQQVVVSVSRLLGRGSCRRNARLQHDMPNYAISASSASGSEMAAGQPDSL